MTFFKTLGGIFALGGPVIAVLFVRDVLDAECENIESASEG